MELIKPIVKVGNSAGVILPKDWLNGEAKITLIRKPRNIKQDILDILEDDLSSIIGLYTVGSYARGEETAKSDIDVLGITQNLDKKIKKGRYEINLVSQDTLNQTLKENILPLLPMLKEASSIINEKLLDSYKDYPITSSNLSLHIETTISALNVIKESIGLAKEENERISDNIIYSLILRLREAYIVDCLLKGKIANNTDLIKLIKKLTGSKIAYDSYQRSKSNARNQRKVNFDEAEKIYNYVISLIEEQKRWIKRRD